jgi:hypothetical protein
MGAQPVFGLSLCVAALVVGVVGPRRLGRLVAALVTRLRPPRPAPPRPVGRPIQEIARDAQRLGLRFRYVPSGVSFARYEASRRAYDEVLAEACQALDVAHLLQVLPPGQELDNERDRVELVLYWAGLRLDDAA